MVVPVSGRDALQPAAPRADTLIVRLLVLYQHAPTPGAPGIYRHRTLLAELVRRGWEVDLVSSPINYMEGQAPEQYRRAWYVREEIDGIVHHWVRATGNVHVNMKRRALNYATFAFTSLMRSGTLARPDVVWASSPPLSVATTGRLVAARFRRPWILEVRDLWPESVTAAGLLRSDSRTYRMIERMAHRYASNASAVLVPTPVLQEQVRAHGARDVTLVTGVIDDTPPDPADRIRIRRELGVPDDACLFAYVGAHGMVNGLNQLLDAAERVTSDQSGADARFVLAGDGSARAELEARLQDHPIPAVQMIGTIPKESVKAVLAAADVGLHLLRPDPVFAGALPTKALEYLGAHRPFITTVPGLPQRVASESGGGFAPDVPSLATELLRWCAMQPEERSQRGERAVAYGREHFGLTATVDRLETLLVETAESGAEPH
jgi:colanic acid biosynthesis glycosyl transferase WcaI